MRFFSCTSHLRDFLPKILLLLLKCPRPSFSRWAYEGTYFYTPYPLPLQALNFLVILWAKTTLILWWKSLSLSVWCILQLAPSLSEPSRLSQHSLQSFALVRRWSFGGISSPPMLSRFFLCIHHRREQLVLSSMQGPFMHWSDWALQNPTPYMSWILWACGTNLNWLDC